MLKKYNIWQVACHYLETGLFLGFLYLTKYLSIVTSSRICGRIVSWLGYFFHKTNALALNNLAIAMPDSSINQRRKILRQVWRNVGHYVGEFQFVYALIPDQEFLSYCWLDDESAKNLAQLQELQQHSGIIITSGHFGNWEAGIRFLQLQGLQVNGIYRALNNRPLDKIILKMRQRINANFVAKDGAVGIRSILHSLQQHGILLQMMDQYLSYGVDTLFFNKMTKTADFATNMAINFKAPIFPIYAVRHKDKDRLSFQIIVRSPIFPSTIKADPLPVRQQDSLKMLAEINHSLEQIILEHPEQWFWLHNRWKIQDHKNL